MFSQMFLHSFVWQQKHKITVIHKWLLWLCVFVLFEPRLAVFCSPWIKLHDAETLGGQTGDSTHSAVRGGEITLLVCLFQTILCHHAKMTSSHSWLSSFSLQCLFQCFLRWFSPHLEHTFAPPQPLINQVWLSEEKMQLVVLMLRFLSVCPNVECLELNIKSGLQGKVSVIPLECPSVNSAIVISHPSIQNSQ